MKTHWKLLAVLLLTLVVGASASYAVPSKPADLSITKFASQTNLTIGSNVVFTLTLQNFGPSNVNATITVTDCLPAGLTYVTDSTVGNTNNGTYSPGTCDWTFPGGMASNGAASITITAQASTAGTWTNTASVGPPSGYSDPNLSNNTSSVVLTLTSNAPTPIMINCPETMFVSATSSSGATVFFNVTTSGGCSSVNVTSSPPSGSVFPAGTNIVTSHASDSCGDSTNCSFMIIVTNPPIFIECPPNIVTNATSTNGATVFFNNPMTFGGCSSVNVTSSPPSGSLFPVGTNTVYFYASDSCGTFTNCSFTITVLKPTCVVSVTCPSNIIVTSTVPTNIYFAVTGSDSCGGTVTVTSTPPSGSSFPIGTTTVTSIASDANGTNMCSFTVTVVKPTCIISVTCPSNIVVTSTVPTNIYFAVTGSDSCGGTVTVTSTPPSGSTFPIGTTTVTSIASDANGTNMCSFTVTVVKPTCIISITCPSNIVVTSSVPTNVYFEVAASDSCGGTLMVTANPPSGSSFPIGTTTVTSIASDANGTNMCSFTVTVTNSAVTADLMVTKTASTNTVVVGQQVVFTVLLTNLGPNLVTNSITVTDCIPAGFEYVTDNTVGTNVNGSYSPGTCWWTWSSGLGVGTVAELQITAVAITNGVFTNTAEVGVPAGVTDPDMANNSSSVTVTNVLPQADLAVIKTASTNTAKVGDTVVFTIMLTNLGPNLVTNSITVTDCLPAGFTYVTDSTVGNSSNGVYSPGTCWWTWSSGLGTNTVAQLQITTTASATNVYTNVAQVGVPEGIIDTNLSNNTSYAVVTNIQPQADLQITKSASTTNLQTGQQVTFTITLNNLGPDNVTNQITVTDCLPASLNYVSSTVSNPSNGVYSPGACVWIIQGGIATNSPQTLTITAQATTNTCYTNTASVAVPTGVTDPNLSNNTASVSSCINPLWTITGSVRNCSSNGSSLPSVTVTLTGPTNLTTTTDTNGSYSFTNLVSGTYTVTPMQAGNTFAPASTNVTLSSANATVPAFVGSVPMIYGQITYSTNGTPVPGVLVKLTGPVNTTTLTSSNGTFNFTNTPPGTYIVTPAPTNGYVFAPTNKTIVLSATNCSGNANFTSSNRTVQLVAMEVTQVIQDWSNSVTLVANKKTFLRAHMQLPTNNLPPVLVQGARIYGSNNGGALPGSPISPINTNGSILVSVTNAGAVRGVWTNALDFQLPASWTTGTISLQFVWSNNVTLVINCPPPAGSTNGNVSCTFSNMPAIPVRYYGFNFTNAANAGMVQNVSRPVFTYLGSTLTAMYPVPDISRDIAQYIAPSMLSVPQVIPPAARANRITNFGEWTIYFANTRLQTTRVLDRLQGSFGNGVSNVVYYGAIAGLSPDTLGVANSFLVENNTAIAQRQLLIASGFIGTSIYGADYRQSHSHEIGHTLGRPHDVMANGIGVCTERGPRLLYPLFQTAAGVYTNKPAIGPMTLGTNALIYGLDTAALAEGTYDPVVSPFVYFDIMSYCSVNPLDEWISTFTYSALITNIATNFNTVTPPVATPLKTYKLVRGVINETITNAYMQTILTFTSTNAPPATPPGRYLMQLYNSSTNLIGQVSFDPDQFENEDESEMEDETLDTFVLPVEVDNTNVTMIALVDSDTMTTLGSLTAPPDSPTVSGVTLNNTNGGSFTGTGDLVINWTGNDVDPGSTLTYTVQYSTDDGATWSTLDPDFTGTSLTIDSSTLQPSQYGLIQVIASDGFNGSSPAFSSVFTIPAHPPSVTIYSPANDSVYVGDQQIFFDVSAVDQIDGVLSGNNVQWVSSINGVLGYGAQLNLEADMLSEGSHTITAYAFDSSSLTGSNSVQIYVLQQMPPEMSITYDGQLQLTWPASYTNYTMQSATTLSPPASWSGVTNTPVVNGAYQTITITPNGTQQYFRLNHQ